MDETNRKRMQTGLKYTDGTPICEGDTIVLWHEAETQKKLIPYERVVEWNDDMAGYVTVCKQYGWMNFLYKEASDINCKKITKKITESS